MSDHTTTTESGPSVEELLTAGAPAEPALVVQYPSRDFPPPPPFRLHVPADWLAMPVPEAEMALRDPVPIDGFHPNVVVRVRRVAATGTVADDLLRSVAAEQSPPGVEIVAEEVRTDLDTPARWLLVRFHGPDGRPLLARHLLVYVPTTEHVASVVTVVGTYPASVATAYGPPMDRIVGSLELASPEPAPTEN